MSFSPDKATDAMTLALKHAMDSAKTGKNIELTPLHLAFGLYSKTDSFGYQLISKIAQNQQKQPGEIYTPLMRALREAMARLPTQDPPPQRATPNHACTSILDKCEDLRSRDKSTFISADHAILALYDDAKLTQLLKSCGLSKEIVTQHVVEMKKGKPTTSRNQEATFDALSKYGRNLNELAAAGKLDPVIGRGEEIQRVVQILSRKRKNNACLTGQPGIGKTAVAEALALRIVNKDVPDSLKNTIIMELNIVDLMAGSSERGELEERLEAVLQEVTESNGQVILFIDEIHLLVGTSGAGGDLANLLKPALARGEVRVVGATTDMEYTKYIEKDAALERRFARVRLAQPTVEECTAILRGIKGKYESFHGVSITDEAIVACSVLSDRYITSRFLPDKAIDLLDQASAKKRVELDSKPIQMDELERRLLELQIEQAALRGEIEREADRQKTEAGGNKSPKQNTADDTGNSTADNSNIEATFSDYAQNRLKVVEEKIEEVNAQLKPLTEQYELAYGKVKELQNAKIKLDDLQAKIDLAQRNRDLSKLSDLKYFVLPELQQKIKQLEASVAASKGQQNELINDVVTADDVRRVISTISGIPLERLGQDETKKFLELEGVLSKKIIGQHEAVSAVSDAVLRSRAGFGQRNKPLASFFFMGPTGTGKSLTAKVLSQQLFDSDSSLLRFDMSEYSESHSISKLIGAPPSYVGFDEGAKLVDAVRTNPYRVILFDEIEKAHSAIHTALLQVLDDGRLTDNKGNVADFSNTIIIFTSNCGAEYIMKQIDQNGNFKIDEAIVREKVLDAIKLRFPPEFLNRLSELILFKPLNTSDMVAVVDVALQELSERVKDHNITIKMDPETISKIFIRVFDPMYGARPVLRALEKVVVTELSKLMLSGKLPPHSLVTISTNMAEFNKLNVEKDGGLGKFSGVAFADDEGAIDNLLQFNITAENAQHRGGNDRSTPKQTRRYKNNSELMSDV